MLTIIESDGAAALPQAVVYQSAPVRREKKMLTLNQEARDILRAYFEGKEITPLRVYLAGGCSGPHLALALDDRLDTDEALEVDGFTFLVDKDLLEEAKPLSIEASPMGGFEITSSLALDNIGGGCGACHGCG